MRHPLHSTSTQAPQAPTPSQASCYICAPKRRCPWHQVELDVVEAGLDRIKRDGGPDWTAADEIGHRRDVADIYFGLRHADDPKEPVLRGLYRYARLLAAMDDPPWEPDDLTGIADWLERAPGMSALKQAEDTLGRAIAAYEGETQ